MLTRNFTEHEFDAASIAWPAQYDGQRAQLAVRLQWLRDLVGVPGIITSAFRTSSHNADVGGTDTSQHMRGEAVDIVFPLAPLRMLAARVLASIATKSAPAFGQIIFYPDRGHVHISLPTLGARNGEVRYSVTADGSRAYPFLTTANDLPILSESQAKAASGAALGVAFMAALALGALLIGGRVA